MPQKEHRDHRINWIVTEKNSGTSYSDIAAKYQEKYGLSSRTFDNDYAVANQKYTTQQQFIAKQLEQKTTEAVKDIAQANVATVAFKREKLKQIMDGDLEVEKVVPTKEGFKKIKAKPDHIDIMKAIEIDNKMTGDNAPDKVESKQVIDVFVEPENDEQ